MAARILVADDEPSLRKVLDAQLRRSGHEVVAVADGALAIAALEQEPFHLVVTDLKMPHVDGLGVLRWVVRNQPGLPVILITAHGTVDAAVEALREGAYDFVTKPFDREELQLVIDKALRNERQASRRVSDDGSGLGIVGTSAVLRELLAFVEKVARSPTTVLISGESGTGKELVARALHSRSGRETGPFIAVNCGAIPESLFEAELFGHERGAFTGAVTSKPGRMELAQGGTLFLDEVGELPKDMQVKLLRALQERTITRVGGVRTLELDVRVVAATNVDLGKAVADGRFREDLYYRLNVVPIRLAALRDRSEDVPALVAHFLARFNQRLGKSLEGVLPEAMAALQAWSWPGNIRELENVMERAVLLADGPWVGPQDLPAELVRDRRGAPEPEDEPGPSDGLGLKEYLRVHTAKLERTRIQRVLGEEDGNVTRAARRLGISRKSLQVKMKEYGLRES
jgi:two-component system response regulator AtoC